MASAAVLTPEGRGLDRRRFLGGAWLRRRRDGEGRSEARAAARPVEAATILVYARPERLAETETSIAALDRIHIQSRNSTGRLSVAVEAADSDAVATALSVIVTLPGVLSATLASPVPAAARRP